MKKIILTFIVASLSFLSSYAQVAQSLADPKTLLMLFPANTPAASIADTRSRYKATPIKILPNTGVHVWRLDTFPIIIVVNKDTLHLNTSIEVSDNVKSNTQVSSDPNYTVQRVAPTHTMSDSMGCKECKVTNIVADNNQLPPTCFIGAKPILVAIADCGIGGSYNNGIFTPKPSYNNLFAGKLWKNSAELPDNLDNDANSYVNDYTGWNWADANYKNIDDHNHGSHVSGIVAQLIQQVQYNYDLTFNGRNSDLTLTNSAARNANNLNISTDILPDILPYTPSPATQNVKIMNLKTQDATGRGSLLALVEAIDYAMGKNAHIMNLSLSYKGKRAYSQQSLLKKVIDTAGICKNMLFVVAAGNNGVNLDANTDSTYFPAYFNSNNMIVVMADSAGKKPSFSNYGTTSVDIAAPGFQIKSTLKDGWGTMTGTSMATPFVTATAAILGTYSSVWSYSAIKAAILNFTTLPNPTWAPYNSSKKTLNIPAILGCSTPKRRIDEFSKSENEVTSSAALVATPNPFNDWVQIHLNSPVAVEGALWIRNAVGQTVFQQQINCQAGDNAFEWQATGFTAGLYLVKVQLPNQVLTLKVLKQ
ncbi:MAG: hypothetical protein RLZZ628_2298 [Bacteroidota bacterium]|jgi:subtilisin family serine protease